MQQMKSFYDAIKCEPVMSNNQETNHHTPSGPEPEATRVQADSKTSAGPGGNVAGAAEETAADPGRESPETKTGKDPGKRRHQPRGLASLFEKRELKDLFQTYLITLCVIEGFIFFVSFLSQLGPEAAPFPWKACFFAAFTVPLAITFLLGVIVISFDRYIFGHHELTGEASEFMQAAAETQSKIQKLHAFLYVIRQAPFLLGLLALVALSGIAYKLDAILAIIGHVGERTAHYLFIGLAMLVAVGVVGGLIWLFLNYNLRKKAMEFEYQYKKDVVEKTGLVFIGNDRVMDNQGRLLSLNQMRQLSLPSESGDSDDDDPTVIIES